LTKAVVGDSGEGVDQQRFDHNVNRHRFIISATNFSAPSPSLCALRTFWLLSLGLIGGNTRHVFSFEVSVSLTCHLCVIFSSSPPTVHASRRRTQSCLGCYTRHISPSQENCPQTRPLAPSLGSFNHVCHLDAYTTSRPGDLPQAKYEHSDCHLSVRVYQEPF